MSSLYCGALKLFDKKDVLENHLSNRTSDLFGLEDKIIIYDLTYTYLGGSVRNSKIAKFGLEVMDSHKLVASTMKISENEEVKIIRCSEPTEKVREIYRAVKITEVPFKPKKSVRYRLNFQKLY